MGSFTLTLMNAQCTRLQRYLDADVELPLERVIALTEETVGFLNTLITKLKNIYLVENMIESLKFAAGD